MIRSQLNFMNATKNNSRVLIAVWLAVLIVASLLLFVRSARADTVPVNGTFTGGLSGWLCYLCSANATWNSSSGYGGGAAVQVPWDGYLLSTPFLASGSSSMSYYGRCVSSLDCGQRFYVFQWTASTWSEVTTFGLTDTYQEKTQSLASYAGNVISIAYREQYNVSYVSTVSVSNATLVGADYYRGTFDASNAYWIPQISGCGSGWSSTEGYGAAGSLSVSAVCDNVIASVMLEGQSTTWDMWVKGGNNFDYAIYAWDFEVGNKSDTLLYSQNDFNSSGVWQGSNFGLSTFGTHPLLFSLHLNTQGSGTIYIDDICPSWGCESYLYGTPTATPIPSSTPLPTWTPNLNNPTPIYGGGTPVPVAIGTICPPDNPCYVTALTPLPVDWAGGVATITAGGGIPIQGGNSTPVNVQFATPQVTAVSAAAVSVGGSSSFFRSSDVSGVMPVGGASGSVGSIVGVDVDKTDVQGCLPGAVASAINTGGNDCVSVPVYNVTEYRLLGVDLLPLFGVVMIALFVVFIIRQLQER